MKIKVTYRNKDPKIIEDYNLEEELKKVISIKGLNISEILYKLDRGDYLGFNDVFFKKI